MSSESTPPSLIAIVGPTASGTSTFGRLLAQLLSQQDCGVLVADVREILDWGQGLTNNAMGTETRYWLKEHPINSRTFPCLTMHDLLGMWLVKAGRKLPKVDLIIGCGFPQSIEQLRVVNLFGNFVVINVDTSEDLAQQLWLKHAARQPAGKTRGLADMDYSSHWEAYREKTLPMLDSCKRPVLRLDRSAGIHIRLKETINFLLNDGDGVIGRADLTRAGLLFDRDTHPIHDVIRQIEQDDRLLPSMADRLQTA